MARLTATDKAALRQLTAAGWVQAPHAQRPGLVEPTPEARERYCRWATEMSRLDRGGKPVWFVGSQWRL